MKCIHCGTTKTVKPRKVRHEVKVDGATFVGMLPGTTCSSCKDTQIVLDDLIRFEHAVAKRLAEHGPVSGASLRYMRKSIPLSAATLAELLRVAPETISRWETGERAVDRAAWLVVRGLLLHREEAADVASLSEEPTSEQVAIAV